MLKKCLVICLCSLVLALMIGCRSPEDIQDLTQPKPEEIILWQGTEQKNTMSIAGQGEVIGVPDLATVWVTLEAEDEEIQTAKDANNKKLEALMTTLKAFGVLGQDIKTEAVQVDPVYDKNGVHIIGYQVLATLSFKTTNIKGLGRILDGVTAAESMVDSIAFGLTDTEPLYQEALLLALQNADEKAKLMAEAGRMTLKKRLSVQETSNRAAISEDVLLLSYQDMAEIQAPSMEQFAGERVITAMVLVEYEMENIRDWLNLAGEAESAGP